MSKKAKSKKVTKKTGVNAADGAAKPAPKASKKASKRAGKKATKKVVKNATKQVTDVADGSRSAQIQALLDKNLNELSGDKAEQMAQKIWLAGLGAYAKTFEELSERYDDVQEKYDEINSEGQKLFNQLVERGKSMQSEFEQAVDKGRVTLEQRVEELRERVGGGLSSFIDIPGRLKDAAERIEELSDRLKNKS